MFFLILCLFIRFCSELIPKTDISVSSAMSVRGRGNLVWVPRHHFSRDSSLLHSALWISSSPGSQPCKDSAVEGAKRIPQGLEGRAGSWDGAVPQLGIPVRSAISWKAELQLHTSQARLCSRGSSGAPGGLVLPPWPRTFSSHHRESPPPPNFPLPSRQEDAAQPHVRGTLSQNISAWLLSSLDIECKSLGTKRTVEEDKHL